MRDHASDSVAILHCPVDQSRLKSLSSCHKTRHRSLLQAGGVKRRALAHCSIHDNDVSASGSHSELRSIVSSVAQYGDAAISTRVSEPWRRGELFGGARSCS